MIILTDINLEVGKKEYWMKINIIQPKVIEINKKERLVIRTSEGKIEKKLK